jgi:hypothetical protein
MRQLNKVIITIIISSICFTAIGSSLKEELIRRINRKGLNASIQGLSKSYQKSLYADMELTAGIKSSKYSFEWLIYPHWTWWSDTATDTSSPYILYQNYMDTSTYEASLWLVISREKKDPNVEAQLSINEAVIDNWTIVVNQEHDSIGVPKNAAIRNSFTWNSNGKLMSTSEWHFTYNGSYYEYIVLTSEKDWSQNRNIYVALKDLGLLLPVNSLVKSSRLSQTKPFLEYYNQPNGEIRFGNVGPLKQIFIYDLHGGLIRTLSNSDIWDGKDVHNKVVSTGFYISNLLWKSTQQNMKILKK